MSRYTARKSLQAIVAGTDDRRLSRTLGPVSLIGLGIGCIIGAGIFVLTGKAAASYAGPAIMLSFVLSGIACGFVGLCYAELAAMIPVAGSAYTYTYATIGEIFAWIIGWDLILLVWTTPDGIKRARMRSLKISDKGGRPWNRLAELAWIRRNTFSSFTE